MQTEGISPQLIRVFRAFNVAEDHAGKLALQLLRGFAGQLGHIAHIHTGFLRDRHRQCFAGSIHAGDGHMRTNGALGEHISFSF